MSEFDRIEKWGRSTIQHGPSNSRVYLMHCDSADFPDLPKDLIAFAREKGYGKVFGKIPASALPFFQEASYEVEAEIPGYFQGEETALLVSFFTDPGRREGDRSEAHGIRDKALARQAPSKPSDAPACTDVFLLDADDVNNAARLYRAVFETYPFPIHDPAYLRHTMESHVAYYGVRENGLWVALASAEKDWDAKAAELTDFATHPDIQGRGMAGRLLARMEQDLMRDGFPTGYTIARALSPGMNIVFARAGYAFGGQLWNNTQICGRLEPMNIWYKALRV